MTSVRVKRISRRKRKSQNNIRIFVSTFIFAGLMAFGQNCSESQLNLGTTNASVAPEEPEIQSQSGLGALGFGGEINLQVTNADPNATYQWFKDGQLMFNMTGTNMVISPAQKSDSGEYHVETDSNIGSNKIEITVRDPRSCSEIRSTITDTSLASGPYVIDPDGDTGAIQPFSVNCDMVTDGGGWTEITLATAALNFGATLADGNADAIADTKGVEAGTHKPFNQTQANNRYNTHYDINTSFMFSQFFVKDYVARSNAGAGNNSEIGFTVVDWTDGSNGVNGDIGFGSPLNAGPTASFNAAGDNGVYNQNVLIPFSQNDTIFDLGLSSSVFRIGFSGNTGGGPTEGWFPWDAGTIWVR